MSNQQSVNRIKIPLKGGGEQDVHGSWRKVLCYVWRVTKKYKRTYNKRLRRTESA